MTNERDTLGKIQAISVIFASIAIPIIVTFFAWQSQQQISEQQLNKDYLEIAIDVLNKEKVNKDSSITQWAEKTFNKVSKEQSDTDILIDCAPMDLSFDLPLALLEPPLQWEKPNFDNLTPRELTISYIENLSRFEKNTELVKVLQKTLVLINDSKKN